jgi:hypothetical protein
MSAPIREKPPDRPLTPRQRDIIELLQRGYSTGYIQATLHAARSTISRCKKLLRSSDGPQFPPSPTTSDTRSQIIELLLTRLRSGAPGAAATAKILLDESPPSLQPDAEPSLSPDDACNLLYQWDTDKKALQKENETLMSTITEMQVKLATWRYGILNFSKTVVTSNVYLDGAGTVSGRDGYPLPFAGRIISLTTYSTTGVKHSANPPVSFALGDRLCVYATYDAPYMALRVRINDSPVAMQNDLVGANGPIMATVLIRLEQL